MIESKPIRTSVRIGKTFTSEKSINVRNIGEKYYRADLVFDKVDHAVPSYEGRVFLNNKKANYDTSKNLDEGYIGSYYIFGPGQCIGDEGHCKVIRNPQKFRIYTDHPPAKIFIIITDKLKELTKKTKDFTVTVVPIMSSYDAYGIEYNRDDVVSFEKVSIITYDKE